LDKAPYISVIIPTYNRKDLLKNALSSIITQSFPHWEAIVVDDGSTEKAEDLVKNFNEDRFHYYYKKNGGLASARNFGIEKAQGKYICYLDDDDLYADHMFETISKEAEADTILVFAYEMKDMSNKLIKTVRPGVEDRFVCKYIEETYSPIPFVYPRDIAKSLQFDEDDVVYEDVPYILPLIAKNRLKCIDKVSCIVRQHKERITGTKYSKYKDKMYSQVNENICQVIESVREHLPYSEQQRQQIIYSKFDTLLKGTAQSDWNYIEIILNQIKSDYPSYQAPSYISLRVKWLKALIKKLFGK